ncbi:MAG: DUF2225 domain-containing protein [bacterium]|nr:DUF2225 domain-containing protein [bacterium]
MAGSSSPFVTKEVACPACKETHPQRFFRQRMYVAGDKESDQHVLRFKWLSETAEPVHPPYYFLFHCPHCYFTDTTEDFGNPTRADTIVYVNNAYRKMGDRHQAFVELVGKHINYDLIDFRSALNLHFLAVFGQLLPEKDMRDTYKIARLMLRAAWLYREAAPTTEGEQRIPTVDTVLDGAMSFEGALQRAQEEWMTMSRAVARRIEELDQKPSDTENPYTLASDRLNESLEGVFGELHQLKALCKSDLAGDLGGASMAAGDAYHEFPSHEAFLAKVKAMWPVIPTDEREALMATIRLMHEAISTDARFDSPQAHFTGVSLIADLHCRCNDYDGAFNMVRGMYKTAADGRMRHQRDLRERKDLDEVQRKRLLAGIRRANASLSQAADLRRTLLERMLDRDMPRIREVMARNPKATPDQLEALLVKEGISQGLIAHLKEKDSVFGKPRAKR